METLDLGLRGEDSKLLKVDTGEQGRENPGTTAQLGGGGRGGSCVRDRGL